MARNLHPLVAEKVGKEHRGVTMVKIDFEEPLFAHNRLGIIEYEGEYFHGVGDLGEVEQIQENSDLTAARVNLILTQIPPQYFRQIWQHAYQNREVIIWYALLDDDIFSNDIIGEPIMMFNGLTGEAQIKYGDSAQITLEAVDELMLWDQTADLRYTNANQQRLYADDTSLQYIEESQTPLTWGGA